jgi:type I restriction enzyme S subunit
VEEGSESLQEAAGKLDTCRKSYLENVFSHDLPNLKSLDQIADIMSGGTPARKRKDYWNGKIPWLSPKDMKKPILDDTTEHITELAAENGAKLAPPDTIFVVVRGMILAHTFPVCRSEVSMSFNQDVRAIVPSPTILPEYLHAWFDWAAPRYLTLTSESSHGTKRLETTQLLSLNVPHFNIPEQKDFLKPLEQIGSASKNLANKQVQLAALKRSLLLQIGETE